MSSQEKELARLMAQVKILERDMLTKRGKLNISKPPAILKKKKLGKYTTKGLMRMTKKKLKELCDEHELGIEVDMMKKKDIVDQIMEAIATPQQPQQPPPLPQPKPVLMDLEKLDEMKQEAKKSETKKSKTKKPKAKKPETKKPETKKPKIKKVKVVKSTKKSK